MYDSEYRMHVQSPRPIRNQNHTANPIRCDEVDTPRPRPRPRPLSHLLTGMHPLTEHYTAYSQDHGGGSRRLDDLRVHTILDVDVDVDDEDDVVPEDFHQLQAHAAFILSEGASTAAEGACLGVPSVYINSTEPRGYLQMLERDYGLVRAFREAGPGLDEATNWIKRLGESEYARCMANRKKMLNDHINVASHVVQVVEEGIV